MAVCCVIGADRGWLIGLLVALAGGLAGKLSGSRIRGWIWLACGLLAVSVFCVKKGARTKAEQDLVGTGGRVEATILSDAKGGNGGWSAPARLGAG